MSTDWKDNTLDLKSMHSVTILRRRPLCNDLIRVKSRYFTFWYKINTSLHVVEINEIIAYNLTLILIFHNYDKAIQGIAKLKSKQGQQNEDNNSQILYYMWTLVPKAGKWFLQSMTDIVFWPISQK